MKKGVGYTMMFIGHNAVEHDDGRVFFRIGGMSFSTSLCFL